MLKLRRRLDLGQKSLGAKRRGEIRVQHLDRDIALVSQVMSKENGRHAADSNFSGDTVPGIEGRGQPGKNVAHGWTKIGERFLRRDAILSRRSSCWRHSPSTVGFRHARLLIT